MDYIKKKKKKKKKGTINKSSKKKYGRKNKKICLKNTKKNKKQKASFELSRVSSYMYFAGNKYWFNDLCSGKFLH